MGSRYGGLKQIDPVGPGGEAIMDYSIYDALRARFGKVVFILRKEIEQQFRQSIGARFEQSVDVEYVFQQLDQLPQGLIAPAGRTKPWGTTQAVLAAESVIDEPFAVINADDFYGAESYRLIAQHLESGVTTHALAGYVLRRTLSDFGAVARGVCAVDDHDMLEGVVERTHIERDGSRVKDTATGGKVTELTGDEIVSMNMWGFQPEIFAPLRASFARFLARSGSDLKAECYLPATMNELIREGKAAVKVLRSTEEWFGVTYQEDRARVVASIRRLIQQGLYPERLWA
jgi:NDP-sugar pyrophosphorylase family protein